MKVSKEHRRRTENNFKQREFVYCIKMNYFIDFILYNQRSKILSVLNFETFHKTTVDKLQESFAVP